MEMAGMSTRYPEHWTCPTCGHVAYPYEDPNGHVCPQLSMEFEKKKADTPAPGVKPSYIFVPSVAGGTGFTYKAHPDHPLMRAKGLGPFEDHEWEIVEVNYGEKIDTEEEKEVAVRKSEDGKGEGKNRTASEIRANKGALPSHYEGTVEEDGD